VKRFGRPDWHETRQKSGDGVSGRPGCLRVSDGRHAGWKRVADGPAKRWAEAMGEMEEPVVSVELGRGARV
jgi:hypothetical protein